MARLRIRKDDMVRVISGRDRGKTGRVVRVDPKTQRVWVEGVNIQKKHLKPRTLRDVQRQQQVGGVLEREGPVHISNVMLIDPKSGQPTRVGVVRRDGRRVRIAKRSGAEID
ncbi:50S ribosomal protein L24 [Thermoleophilum album]|uniref:50S ribosomal protein L24 n=1 Tax=Thermoleophilum album TaxID=29539 RepID=UPI00237CFE2E|nr:50S ribosomal protein L24 [Thermoleophilum album]